jgi:hypothetical protein
LDETISWVKYLMNILDGRLWRLDDTGNPIPWYGRLGVSWGKLSPLLMLTVLSYLNYLLLLSAFSTIFQ